MYNQSAYLSYKPVNTISSYSGDHFIFYEHMDYIATYILYEPYINILHV
jgi:hypothetical protein